MKLKEKLRWTYFTDMLEDEYRQCECEGKAVTKYKEIIQQIISIEDGEIRERKAAEMIRILEQETVKDDYPYEEPSVYDEIQKVIRGEKEIFCFDIKELRAKLQGAWVGRASGCLLGIPVEGWSRKKILKFLKETGQYPLSEYIDGTDSEEIHLKYQVDAEDEEAPYDRVKTCWRENITEYPVDDDNNYPVCALKIVERYGKSFDAMDVGEAWLYGFPGLHACTAERVAYRNLMNGILPPMSGTYNNPYREWLGAQIRGDFWGYINPGNPKEAARMAYIDASVSHDKNGIYAEMFVSALCSLAFCEEMTMKQMILRALQEIPSKSRVAEGIGKIMLEYDEKTSFDEIINRIHLEYNEGVFFDWCYVIPNIEIIVAVLLYYSNSYTQAITQTVMSGFDTDCNGATVGSILGICGGIQSIESKWYENIQQTINTSIHGYYNIPICELVERTYNLVGKNFREK